MSEVEIGRAAMPPRLEQRDNRPAVVVELLPRVTALPSRPRPVEGALPEPGLELVGASAALKEVIERVTRVAATDATVLLPGETGTGKGLVARLLHARSARRHRPLVVVNCAALPATLVESELFGHERGAFTSAVQRKLGRFEAAAGGTILLDEIGELPLESQAKLLPVLQDGEFELVGGGRAR